MVHFIYMFILEFDMIMIGFFLMHLCMINITFIQIILFQELGSVFLFLIEI